MQVLSGMMEHEGPSGAGARAGRKEVGLSNRSWRLPLRRQTGSELQDSLTRSSGLNAAGNSSPTVVSRTTCRLYLQSGRWYPAQILPALAAGATWRPTIAGYHSHSDEFPLSLRYSLEDRHALGAHRNRVGAFSMFAPRRFDRSS